MPIGTDTGATEYTTQDIADACGVCVGAATRKYQAWERRVLAVLKACRTLSPAARPCELAEMVLAVLDMGGKLAAHDRDKLRRRLRELLQASAPGS